MAQLSGRVFARLEQYEALPAELKNETEALEQDLRATQGDLFGSHRTMLLKSVYGVRARPLLETIEAWVKTHSHKATRHTEDASATETERVPTPTPTPATSNVGNFQIAGSATPAMAPATPVTTPAYSDPSVGAHIPHAKQLLDALVLKGFVTPYKEEKPDDMPSATEDLEFKDNELLVARTKDLATGNDGGPTVWDLVDGAIFASMLQRKAGLLESITHGKDAYAVVNMRLKNLTIFASDLGREPLAQFDATALRVSFDKSHHDLGVKVWTETESEMLNAATQHESDALLQALLAVGASYRDNEGHGHAAATTAEKLRYEVKHHADSGDHQEETHVSASHAGDKTHPSTHATQTQYQGWTNDKVGDDHASASPGIHQQQPVTHPSGDNTHINQSTHTGPNSHSHEQSRKVSEGLTSTTDSSEHAAHQTPTQQTQQTQQQHGLPTEGVKQPGEPRGFGQVPEPTMTP